jgi:hypothetical protein
MAAAGVGDQNVDRSELVFHPLVQRLHLCKLREVAEHGDRLAARLLQLRAHARRRVRVTSVHGDLRTPRGKRPRHRRADATRAASDPDHPIFEFFHALNVAPGR